MAYRILSALLLVAACAEPEPPPPPAIVGEDDAFSEGSLRPLHATATDLYFYYSDTGIAGRVNGADPGVYRVPVVGGEPTLVVAATGVAGVERSGDDLVMITRMFETARLTTLPLDGGEPTHVALTNGDSIAATSSNGATFVLADDPDDGGMSITRLATEADPELVFAARPDAFVDGWGFHALNGGLYWLEGFDDHMRIADDQSESQPATMQLPPLGSVPTEGQVEDERFRLLGAIGDEVYGSVYYESFYANGETLDNGDPSGDYAFGGGAIYTVATVAADARLVATDIVHAVIAGDWIYGQDRDGDMVRIEPITGEVTKLSGHAPTFGMFTWPVVNDDLLFYPGSEYGAPYSIRYLSLAPRS